MRGRVAFGALPWLMHDRPFVQGLTASAEIGSAMARAVSQQAAGRRRRSLVYRIAERLSAISEYWG